MRRGPGRRGMVRPGLLAGCLAALSFGRAAPAGDPGTVEFFERRIRPMLTEHCHRCHSAEAGVVRGGLRVDSAAGLRRGGESGPAVVPGDPAASLLVAALRHESLEMPPEGRLSPGVIADVEAWIVAGAVDPRTAGPAVRPRIEPEVARGHWAFQPIVARPLPEVADAAWPSNPIDRFILAGLERAGLAPAPEADRATLLRRLSFDLTGLPPTPAELAAFLADDAPDAYERLVDRLLDSPRYGERWGRHWLDLVRYADTNGGDENKPLPNAWRYRDWVIRMFNADLPFDRFIERQLAGDLLPASDPAEADDLLTATGMLVIGPKMLAEQDKDKMAIDIVDEQIDVVGKTFLGLTIACARCHDHKSDPIETADYYALAGIFASTRTMADRAFVSTWLERPLPSAGPVTATVSSAAAEGEQADGPHKTAGPPMVMAVEEGRPTELPIHVRGNHLAPSASPVPRGVPRLPFARGPAAVVPAGRSGRVELARWLTSRDQPLTARVLVNRFWMWHFGAPLAAEPSNLGLQCPPPAHRDLLDWLAATWIDGGWSLKSLHRLICASRTYRMQSRAAAASEARDPDNTLWHRQNRRRLEAEPIRDAILAVGGGLDQSPGGPAVEPQAPRRAVYLRVNRAALYGMFAAFDYVDPASHIERRPVTVVPQQALFMLNADLVHHEARRLAQQASAGREPPAGRIDGLFRLCFARPASEAEIRRAETFLASAATAAGDDEAAWAALCRSLLAANEFIHVE